MTFFYDLNKKLAGLANKTQLNESAKPDFLDVDKDGNKKEAFKKAVKDKETGKVEEAGYSAKAARAGKDIGKPGKQFAKIAKSAGEKYGSKERGEKVAGAVLAKLRGKTTEGEIPPEFQKPKKADVPAYQRKAQGGDWKVTAQDLAKDRERNISDRKGLARLRGADPADIDEGWDDMLKDVSRRSGEMRTGEKRKTSKGEIEKTATGIRHTRSYDEKTGETDTGDDTPAGEKRGRGRPKKYTDDKPRQERVTAKSRKADRTAYTKKKKVDEYGDFGPMESEHDDEVKTALRVLKKAGYKVTKDGEEELDEKAVSKAQQKFMGMAHAMQKGEKIPGASKELKKVAKTMKKGDVEDFAKTKHKGLPEKKAKKEKTEESGTTAGSVATAPAGVGSKGGFQFGKGIYDSMNRELENMISESMNISMNLSDNPDSGASQSLTVTATDEDAVKLAALLKMAGVGGGHEGAPDACPTCGEAPCGCAEKVDENSPDWPTDEVEAESNLEYSGGLNGPKSTGQTTVPVIAGQEDRMGEDDPLKRIREMAGIAEAKAKPDYIDLDKDGDKKEPMKKAAKDKEEKKVEESILGLTNLWKEYKAQ